MSAIVNWSSNDQQSSPYSRKRGRDPDDQSEQASPHHQQRRFKTDHCDRSPRDQQRRRGGQGGYGPRSAPSISDIFSQSVWSLGDSERFDFRREIPELVKRIEFHFAEFPNDVLKVFRIAAAELPHKLPHFALLISLLSVPTRGNNPSESDFESTSPSIGVQIIRDLSRSLHIHIDNRRWRSTRLFVQLFGHLHALSRPLVSSQSLLVLLRAIFSATTDELTCTGARADECLRIVCEGLLRSGLWKREEDNIKKEVSELLESIRVHMVVNRRFDRTLFNEAEALSQYVDPVEELVACLDCAPTLDVLPVLDEPFGPLLELRINATGLESPYPAPFDLPIVLLPPDTEEPGFDSVQPTPRAQNVGHDPGPVPLDSKDRTGYLGMKTLSKLFTDHTVPSRATANGVVLRTLINDIIDIFEVNRKECAKILLELPRWVGRSTFKARSTASKPKPVQASEGTGPEHTTTEKSSDWVLEHLVLESILSSVFAMPSPPIRSTIYYHSLIAEMCRLSPSTVAPGLGKCVRRLYAGLGETGPELVTTRLEPEGIRRFADWFGVHLSNFGFLWAWKDWTEVVDLPAQHPKVVFVARVLELEIRLSYFDRIKGTVPESFIDSGMMPKEAPEPDFEYSDKEHRHHLAALDVTQLLKRKEAVPRLVEYLTKMKERLTSEQIEEPVEEVTRDVAVQALLNVGSRSFSHFLNVLERYLELLKGLTSSTDARSSLLQTVSKFWRKNAQFELIVIDKLLEYRVVDPIDSLRHAFQARKGEHWSEMQFWDGIKLTIEKVTRRVSTSRAKVEELRKAEEDERDVERAAGGQLSESANLAAPGDIIMKEPIEPCGEKPADFNNDEKAEAADAVPESTEISKAEALQAKKEELVAARRELAANIAEQAEVLGAATQAFSIAVAEAEGKAKEEADQEESGSGVEEDEARHSPAPSFWKAWWLRGWRREFCRLFAVEISQHFDRINDRLDKCEGDASAHANMKNEIRITKEWIESVGFQTI